MKDVIAFTYENPRKHPRKNWGTRQVFEMNFAKKCIKAGYSIEYCREHVEALWIERRAEIRREAKRQSILTDRKVALYKNYKHQANAARYYAAKELK